MWVKLLLLALAINLEPVRIALVPVLLARARPALQLAAFLAGSLIVSFGSGLLILLVLHRAPFTPIPFDGRQVQTAVGVLALGLAAVLTLRWLLARRRARSGAKVMTESGLPPSRFAQHVTRTLQKARSPWIVLLIGAGTGVPSADFLAVLALISTSGWPPGEQAAALAMFCITGSLVVLTPLALLLLAPGWTVAAASGLNSFVLSRSQIEYACLLTAAGCLLIAWR